MTKEELKNKLCQNWEEIMWEVPWEEGGEQYADALLNILPEMFDVNQLDSEMRDFATYVIYELHGRYNPPGLSGTLFYTMMLLIHGLIESGKLTD